MKTSSRVGWVRDIEFIFIPKSEDIWKIFGITSVPLEANSVIFF